MLKGVEIETDGIAAFIKVVRQIEPDLAKQLPREMKYVAKPIIETARALLPQPSPLTNWGNWTLARKDQGDRSWGPAVAKGIQATSRTGARKGKHEIPLLAIEQKNGAGAIYENAGRHRPGDRKSSDAGDRFVAVLNEKMEAPRYLWPAVIANRSYLNIELQRVLDEWMKSVEEKMLRAA
jgi:hypothetical protein